MAVATFVAGCAASVSAQGLPPLADVTRLAQGKNHACALTDRGGVMCWGNNQYGQLGDGSTTNRHLPVPVAGLDRGVVELSAGASHTCAVTSAGSVKCWGRNFLGQLGDGTTTNRPEPVQVSGLTGGVASVAAGSAHTCSLDFDGDLRCWGFNADGELGTGDRENRTTPALVLSGPGTAAISVGDSNACALSVNGSVSCWGVYDRQCNAFGCAFGSFSRPTPVSGLGGGIAAISSGEFFHCALTTAGAVKCWGDNLDGQLGDLGTVDPDPFELFDIEGLQADVIAISAGDDHACATLSDNTARCWGRNQLGQLGDGTREDRYPPVTVEGLADAAHVAAGGSFSCARMLGGEVQCWGSNASGQLGNNDPWFRFTPTEVPGLGNGVQAIAAGEFHTCALSDDGAVKCWGANGFGQVGDGSTESRAAPVAVSGAGSGIAGIAAGADHTCAVTQGGAPRCWGRNQFGQLGNGTLADQPDPVEVAGLSSGVSTLSGGDFHTCARMNDGGAKCWGWNIDAQLGDGSLSGKTEPSDVFGLDGSVLAVSAGGIHSCARLSGGAISCWGSNNDGQIGDGTAQDRFIPETLPFPKQGVTAISAGQEHTCAVAGGGEALCWGTEDDGRLGNGSSFGVERTPVRVLGLGSGVASISAGLRHTCAVTSAGAALCWGSNRTGQLGTGDSTRQTTPAAVAGLASGTAQIAVGDSHSCALTTSGAVLCWGSNTSDQLGLNRLDFRLPGPVLDGENLFRSGFESEPKLFRTGS